MALCDPEDKPAVEAAAAEFLKLCQVHGLEPEQILQAGIAVMAAAIGHEAKDDRKYALDLAERVNRSLRSAVEADLDLESGKGSEEA